MKLKFSLNIHCIGLKIPETGTGKTEVKYAIDTELSSGNVKFIPEFLKRNYLLQQKKYSDFRKIGTVVENERHFLTYRVQVPKTDQHVDVVVEANVPIEVMMKLSNSEISKPFSRSAV